jgi:vitamin B12 transporter
VSKRVGAQLRPAINIARCAGVDAMKYGFVLLGLAAGQAVFGGAAFGQGVDAGRDTVEVVGLRLGQTASEAGTAVTVIEAADIERRGQVFVGDVVASAPGLTVSQAGPLGGVSSVRIRGNSVGQTLVLVDGVPVNDAASPGGGYDFGVLDPFGVAQIEVLRGPQSTLWGSDAIGGVISIVTAAPEDGLEWGGFAEAGSFGTWRTGARIAGAGARADGALSLVFHAADGISKADEADGNTEKDGYASFNVSGRSGVDLSDKVRVEGIARWTQSEFDFDGFPPPNFVLGDSDERSENDELMLAGRLSASLVDGRFRNEVLVSQSEIGRRSFSGGVLGAINDGARTSYRYNGGFSIADGHEAMFGVEREDSDANGESARTDSVFGLYEFSAFDRLTLTAGVRHDDDDRYGAETTGRAAASWEASDNVRLRASWGQGFKAPTIFQTNYICTFCGLSAPNADLRAETSEAFDLGIDFDLGGGELSLTAFDQDTEDLIDFSFTQGYANIALAKQRGVEAAFSGQFTDWLGVYSTYTYIDAEDGTGAALPRVPEHSGTFELAVGGEGPARASLMLRYNGEQSDGFGPNVSSWVRTDVSASYAIGLGVEVYGRIENLLDEDYQQVGGYGTPGVSGYLGIRVRN